ncbi:kinase-like protein [Neoconidiobolus thromboides FSU 785]|nr:kinase-like protein [Neoconidiobolus thromboides FSU 785]
MYNQNDNNVTLSPPPLAYNRRPSNSSSNLSVNSQSSNKSPITPTTDKLDSNVSTESTETSSPKSTTKKTKGFLSSLWSSFIPKREEKEMYEGPILESNYEIKKRIIARGSTGLIGLVTSLKEGNSGKVMIVKRFSKPRWGETYKDIEQRVGNEYCISSALNHKNIVKVYDLVKDSNSHWCQIMEYCSGGDMCHIISNGILNKPEANCCFKQLLNGIKYLHETGIAHCDIKPENLVMDRNCVLKITDFGCAVSFCSGFNTPCDVVMGIRGSLPYMAPEMITKTSDSDKGYDARLIDVWSCAIAYLTMINLRIPFSKADEQDRSYKEYINTRFDSKKCKIFEKLNKDAREVIVKMLEPSPNFRSGLKEIMDSNWFNYLEVCEYGQSKSSHHQHFACDYRPGNCH